VAEREEIRSRVVIEGAQEVERLYARLATAVRGYADAQAKAAVSARMPSPGVSTLRDPYAGYGLVAGRVVSAEAEARAAAGFTSLAERRAAARAQGTAAVGGQREDLTLRQVLALEASRKASGRAADEAKKLAAAQQVVAAADEKATTAHGRLTLAQDRLAQAQARGAQQASVFGRAVTAAATLGLTYGAWRLARGGVGLLVDVERYTKSFVVLTGSAAAAKHTVEELMTFRAGTPFETDDILEAARNLLQVDKYSVQTMRDMGNLAAVSGQTVAEMSTAYQRLFASTRPGMGLMRLMRVVPGLREELGARIPELRKGDVGIEVAEVTQFMAMAGGAEKLRNVLHDIIEEKFGDAMAEQLDTLAGSWTVLGHAWHDVREDVFRTLEPEMRAATRGATYLLRAFNQTSPAMKTLAAVAILTAPALGGVATMMQISASFALKKGAADLSVAAAQRAVTMASLAAAEADTAAAAAKAALMETTLAQTGAQGLAAEAIGAETVVLGENVVAKAAATEANVALAASENVAAAAATKNATAQAAGGRFGWGRAAGLAVTGLVGFEAGWMLAGRGKKPPTPEPDMGMTVEQYGRNLERTEAGFAGTYPKAPPRPLRAGEFFLSAKHAEALQAYADQVDRTTRAEEKAEAEEAEWETATRAREREQQQGAMQGVDAWREYRDLAVEATRRTLEQTGNQRQFTLAEREYRQAIQGVIDTEVLRIRVLEEEAETATATAKTLRDAATAGGEFAGKPHEEVVKAADAAERDARNAANAVVLARARQAQGIPAREMAETLLANRIRLAERDEQSAETRYRWAQTDLDSARKRKAEEWEIARLERERATAAGRLLEMAERHWAVMEDQQRGSSELLRIDLQRKLAADALAERTEDIAKLNERIARSEEQWLESRTQTMSPKAQLRMAATEYMEKTGRISPAEAASRRTQIREAARTEGEQHVRDLQAALKTETRPAMRAEILAGITKTLTELASLAEPKDAATKAGEEWGKAMAGGMTGQVRQLGWGRIAGDLERRVTNLPGGEEMIPGEAALARMAARQGGRLIVAPTIVVRDVREAIAYIQRALGEHADQWRFESFL
jgi:hypothetical protein